MTQYKKQEDVADTYRNSDIEGKKITWIEETIHKR
jgi:hypothetical protein